MANVLPRRRRRFAALLFCALAAPGAAVRGEEWTEVASAEVTVLTDGPAAPAEKLARELAAFRELFASLVLAEDARPLPPTQMVLFKSDRSFRRVKPSGRHAAGRYDGLMVRFEDRSLAAISAEFDERTRRRIAFHEGVHWLLDESGCRPPLWLNEGLAEVFSTFEIADGKYGCGHPVPGHVEVLREQKLWPLPRLFAVDARSPDYSESSTAGMFYAQSWALAHFLLFGEEHRLFRRDAAPRRVLLRGEASEVERLLLERLGGDAEHALAAVQRYVSSGRYVHFTGPYRPPEPGRFTTRRAPPAEVDLAFGLLLASSDRLREAEQRFRAAARARPQDPRPYEGLAFVSLRQHRTGEAVDHYARAIARGSRSAYAHVTLAQEAMAAHQSTSVLAGSEPRAAEWVKHYRVLVGKNSATPELATGFANALFLSPEFTASDCADVEELTRRFPDHPELGYALALLWTRTGNLAAARDWCERVAADEHAPLDLRNAARYTRDQQRIDDALARAGGRLAAADWAGAEATLAEAPWDRMSPAQRSDADRLARQASDRRELATARAEIDSRRFADARLRLRRLVAAADRDAWTIEEARRLLDVGALLELDQHYVERLNAAIDRFNAGETAAGLQELRVVADDPLAPDRLRRQARQYVEQAEAGAPH